MLKQRRVFRIAALLLIVAAVFSGNDVYSGSKPAQKKQKKDAVEVTYIANAGFMVASGGKKVMFDALNKNPWNYRNTPDDIFAKIVKDEAPYNGISALMISHPHDDHYNTEMVRDLLLKNKNIKLLSSVLTEKRLTEELGENYPDIEQKLVTADPEWGSFEKIKIDGIDIKVITVDHTDKPGRKYKTISFVVDLNGTNILYVGDLWPPRNIEYFKEYALQKKSIDIAFVDCYFLQSPEGREIMENFIKPENIVVTHMRPRDIEKDSRGIRQHYPEALIFEKPGEKKTVIVKNNTKR